VNTSPDASYPHQALDAAIQAARISDPIIPGDNGLQHVMMPPNYRLHELRDPFALPPYIAAHPVVDDKTSLIEYTNRFSDMRSIIMADYDRGTICARLDWHHSNDDEAPAALAAQANTHSCTLKLLPSEEFSRWNAFEMAAPKTGGMHSQAEFAAFLEENAADVIIPDPTVLIEISRDLEAVQGVNFASRTRLESGDRAFTYETETKTKGELRVPREFTLAIPLYNGEPAIEIRCALRFQVTPGGLLLGYEWRRVEYARRSHFNAIAHSVAEETGRPVFFGR
jgi:hypothetical protein